MLRIALPNKGRLSDDVRELFDNAGFGIQGRGDRALSAHVAEGIEAIFVRAQDIPELVADGAAGAGITGWDLVCESGRQVEQLLDLEFGRCRLVVAAREESGIAQLSQLQGRPKVATVFPRVTARFFSENDRPVDVVPVSGACEIAPHLGIADVIVDLTSTGSTLKMNGLREVATVLESSARVICSPGLMAEDIEPGSQSALLGELVDALGSVIRARGKRYVMANVPREALPKIREVVPGLNGPTVVDVLGGNGMVAVHAVVSNRGLSKTIAALKSLGAQGILVTKIERLMP